MFARRTSAPLLWYASSLLSQPSLSSSSTSAFVVVNSLIRGSSGPFTTPTTTTTTTTTHKLAFMTTSTSSSSNKRQRLDASVSLGDIEYQTVVSVKDAIGLHNDHANVKFVDGSWFLMDRNGKEEFMKQPRIKDARFFDIDDIADTKTTSLPHMMPPPNLFAAAMDAMGITNDDHIIVYASQGCMFAHRAWFQIRNMGHGKKYTHLLDGSLEDWKEQGGPMEDGPPSHPIITQKQLLLSLDDQQPTKYQATEPQHIVDVEELKALIEKRQRNEDVDAIWVDVRAPPRFMGQVEEPRPGMRLGHMPGAKNVFFKDLLQDDNVSKFKPKEELTKIIQSGGVALSSSSKRIIASCGSGATACALIAALDILGVPADQCYVYDGSWSEWGARDDTPIVKDDDDNENPTS